MTPWTAGVPDLVWGAIVASVVSVVTTLLALMAEYVRRKQAATDQFHATRSQQYQQTAEAFERLAWVDFANPVEVAAAIEKARCTWVATRLVTNSKDVVSTLDDFSRAARAHANSASTQSYKDFVMARRAFIAACRVDLKRKKVDVLHDVNALPILGTGFDDAAQNSETPA